MFFPFKNGLNFYSGSQYKDNINLKEFCLPAHFIIVCGNRAWELEWLTLGLCHFQAISLHAINLHFKFVCLFLENWGT